MIKCNFICYPRKVYSIIPTIVFTSHDKYDVYIKWTIAMRWLRFMFMIVKFNKNEKE